MEFKPAKCPNCGGNLQVPPEMETVKCMYCGTDIVVKQAIAGAAGGNVANWFKLAKAAREGGNNEEAYKYYTQVLEVQPENSEAWYGKAEAAGWSSTLANSRLREMTTFLSNAIQYAPPDQQDSFKSNGAELINSINFAFYRIAKDHCAEYIGLGNVYEDYLTHCKVMIQACEYAHSLAPKNKTIIENIIFFCKDNIEGIVYRDKYDTDSAGNPRKKTLHLSEEYEATIKKKMDDFIIKMKELDPTYQSPKIKKAGGFCFIATAAYGSSLAPEVNFLRWWRDEYLITNPVGLHFVRLYYAVSPPFAWLLSKSEFAKAVVRHMITYMIKYIRSKDKNRSFFYKI